MITSIPECDKNVFARNTVVHSFHRRISISVLSLKFRTCSSERHTDCKMMPLSVTANDRKNRQSRVIKKSTEGLKLPKLPERLQIESQQ